MVKSQNSQRISGKAPLVLIAVIGCVAAAGLLGGLLIPGNDPNTPSPIAGGTTQPGPSTLPAGPTTEEMKSEAVQIADGLVKNLPNDTNAIALAARLHDSLGRSEKSAACWRECLKLAPNRAEACNQLGWAALKPGAYDKAASLLRRAVEIEPGITGGHHKLACALMSLGEHEEAIDHFEKAIDMAPNSLQSHYMLGQTIPSG